MTNTKTEITFQDEDSIIVAFTRNDVTVEFTADTDSRDWGLAGEDMYPAAEAAAQKLGYASPEQMWPAVETELNRAAGWTRTIATGLTSKGRRALAQFLADNLNDAVLATLVAEFERDIVFGRNGSLRGDLEIEARYSVTGRPETAWFEGDEIVTEEVEDEDED